MVGRQVFNLAIKSKSSLWLTFHCKNRSSVNRQKKFTNVRIYGYKKVLSNFPVNTLA